MKLFRIIIPILALLIGAEAVSSAQVIRPEDLSASQRREFIDELYYTDYSDLNLSSQEARDLKANLQNFGNYLVHRGVTMQRIGFWAGFGGAIVCAVAGGATGVMPIVYGSAAFLAGGVALVAVGIGNKSKGMKLQDYSRVIVASSATYPLQMDNLAFGVCTSLNPVNNTVAFGPAVALRF